MFDNKQLFFIKDGIIIKIPFLAKTHEEIANSLRNNKIPWAIFSGDKVNRGEIEKALSYSN